jgi:CheY-specific phosphatase CheX
MIKIMAMDLNQYVSNAVLKVFDTMFSMNVDIAPSDPQAAVDGSRIVGAVGFAGEAVGTVCIGVTYDFAKIMTASMLGMDLDEIQSEEEVNDVIGEVSNMVGGHLKSRLCDAGLPCELTIPTITTGSAFKIEPKHWTRHECLTFKYNEHSAFVVVDVYIKGQQK